MQNAQLDSNEVIIEYITDTQGNKVKKLKLVFIKSELDREHTLHVDNDDNLPAVPEENFTRERERTPIVSLSLLMMTLVMREP